MVSRRPLAGVLCCLLVAAAVGGGVGVTRAQTTEETHLIRGTVTLSLTPDEPGTVDATVTYDLPSAVSSFDLRVPEDATVVGAEGFVRTSFNRYNWTPPSETPSITLRVDANESSRSGRAAPQTTGGSGYVFADPGPWALVQVPRVDTHWTWGGGSEVDIRTSYRVAGEGFVGETMAFLGSHEVYTRTAAAQTFSLVVPETAALAPSPEGVLGALTDASRSLRVGDRDRRVNVIAAPTSVEWAASGLQYGDTDAWVSANATLDDSRNTWIHEYVHTRQAFDAEAEMRWLTEAIAEYYGTYLALDRGYIGFESFQRVLSFGTNRVYRDVVLSRPTTWGPGGNYFVGALVVGNIDRAIRLATGGSATFADVFERLNDHTTPVNGPEFESAVRAVAGDDPASSAAYWTTTGDTPTPWNRSEHVAAFGVQPTRLDVAFGGAEGPTFRVTGPYGERTAGDLPAVYPGETLEVALTVENTGGVEGTETVALVRNDTVVDSRSVTLAPGATTTLTLAAPFEAAGDYSLRAGLERRSVAVTDPPTPTVSDLTVNATSVDPGEAVAVTATVTSPDDAPASGTVAFVGDDGTLAERDVTLAPGERRTLTAPLSFEESGEHTVTVGDRSVTVTVGGATTEPGGVPGFGVAAALAGAALALVAARRR